MSAPRPTPSSILVALVLLVSWAGLAVAQLVPDLPVGGSSAQKIQPPTHQVSSPSLQLSLMEVVSNIRSGVFVYRWLSPAISTPRTGLDASALYRRVVWR